MNIKILDSKSIYGDKRWYLVKASLRDYLDSLRPNFSDFEIQRRIVRNLYLDKLSDTILNGEPMSIITLTGRNIIDADAPTLDVENSEILDGLQRTFRLWSIYYVYKFAIIEKDTDPRSIYKCLKEDGNGKLIIDSHVINLRQIRKLFDESSGERIIDRLIKKYSDYEIYISIWENLNDNEVIQKMLVLNAGQKSVSSTHQYELLFLHFFNELDLSPDIHIIREKDSIYNQVKSKSRGKGDILLTSVIIALQSFIEKKPLRINQVNNVSIEESDLQEDCAAYFSKELLTDFIMLIYQLSCQVDGNDELLHWVGKDTTLSGLFAAIGSMIDAVQPKDALIKAQEYIGLIDEAKININAFRIAYDNLSSTSVNVGNAVRLAVYNYFKAFFTYQNADWSDAFKSSKS